jgi:deoxycytidylate deaminase
MLDLAIKLASQLDHKKQRVASIITDKRGRILSFGCNSYTKSHPKMAWYSAKFNDFNKIYLHSEIDAICHLKDKPHTIYIARVSKSGKSLPAQPCKICRYAINDCGIKEIITT